MKKLLSIIAIAFCFSLCTNFVADANAKYTKRISTLQERQKKYEDKLAQKTSNRNERNLRRGVIKNNKDIIKGLREQNRELR
ncbi:MAG: hypothetical protein IKA03_06325 [Alphaproteobacteria bacterium]|nr:hypothetical protein [Alphaproteobacteria bacterium]